GQGVNPVTGDYSRGAAGYWVEDGAIAHPVEEITIAGNLRRMYRDIVAVGNDVDRRGAMATARPLRERIRAWRRSLQDPLRGGGAAASWVASLPTATRCSCSTR